MKKYFDVKWYELIGIAVILVLSSFVDSYMIRAVETAYQYGRYYYGEIFSPSKEEAKAKRVEYIDVGPEYNVEHYNVDNGSDFAVVYDLNGDRLYIISYEAEYSDKAN